MEELAVVVNAIPGLIPIADQQFLGFLSEFLKTSSVVDGEMSDMNLMSNFTDKNGVAMSTQSPVIHCYTCDRHVPLFRVHNEKFGWLICGYPRGVCDWGTSYV